MKELLEQGGGLVLTGVILGIGLIARLVLWTYYSLLGTACRNPDTTSHRTVCDIREELLWRLQEGTGIRNVMVYLEYRLARCKVLGVRTGVWEGMAERSVLLVLLTGVFSASGGVLWECERRMILAMLFFSVMSAGVLLLLDVFAGLREKRERIRLCIGDYIENRCLAEWDRQYGKAQAACAAEEAEAVHRKRRKEKKPHNNKKELRKEEALQKRAVRKAKKAVKKEEKARKRYLRSSRTRAGKERRKEKRLIMQLSKEQKQRLCKAQMEKRRLTEELLRERRQMEARQLAELKSRERAGETAFVKESKTVAEEEAEKTKVFMEETMTLPEEAVKLPEETLKPKEETAAEAAEAEAAAALETSYEALLREVLAEYLK